MLGFDKIRFLDLADSLTAPGAGLRYGQLGEDCYLWHHFKNVDRGVYVDVGAFHPTQYSNTYLLHRYRRWSGVNIDPNPDTIALFQEARPDDHNLNIGVYDREDELTYHRFAQNAVNTFDTAFAEQMKRRHDYIEAVPVRTRRLDDVLAELGITHVDFLNVDCEGTDREALSSAPWSTIRPAIVAVETHDLNLSATADHPVVKFMASVDYRPTAFYNPTAFFMPG